MKLKLHDDYGDRQFFVSPRLECDEFPFMLIIEANKSNRRDELHHAMICAVSLDINELEKRDWVHADDLPIMDQIEVDQEFAIEMVLGGRFAHLWSEEESNYDRLVKHAKSVAQTLVNCDTFKQRMNEEQNAYGHTGWDVILGNTLNKAKGETR